MPIDFYENWHMVFVGTKEDAYLKLNKSDQPYVYMPMYSDMQSSSNET